jgi:oligopeptidase A
VEAEIDWSDAIDRAWAPVSHLNAVADETSLREAYNTGLQLLTEHQTWRQQHRGIFEVYAALRRSPGFRDLSAAQQRIIELEIRDFHLAGVDLDEKGREQYRKIALRERLGKFRENLLDATPGLCISRMLRACRACPPPNSGCWPKMRAATSWMAGSSTSLTRRMRPS